MRKMIDLINKQQQIFDWKRIMNLKYQVFFYYFSSF